MKKKEDAPSQVPLAIIGLGCLFPKAGRLEEYWANIKGKVDAIGEVPPSHWSSEDYYDADPKKPDMTYARRGGFLEPVDFDPAEFGIAPNVLEATDSAQLLGLVTAGMALRDAGYGPDKEFDRSRVSVILGVTGTLELVVPLGGRLGHPIWRKALREAGIEGPRAEAIIDRIKDGYVPWQENSFPGLLGNVVAGRIANRYNLGGTNCVVDAACASSLSAVHLAGLELANRRSSMVVTGGADCFNDIFMYMCFSKTPALSPSGDSKPFDKSADGTILGEGLGMMVLKRLDDAERDGDRVHAVIRAVGSSSDGRGKSIYAPSAEGQTKALREAYRLAGFGPETIGLVEAHGTGTSVGDAVEVEALKAVYREAAPEGQWCALGSVKSMIGHTKAAAGSAGIIKTAMALSHKVLPPTIKVTEPNPALEGSPFYVSLEKRPWLSGKGPRRAAVSALGFGGSNFHCILEEHRPEKSAADWDGRVQVVALSGASAAALKPALESWVSERPWEDIRVEAAKARASFLSASPARLCFVVEKGKPSPAKAALAALDSQAAKASWSLPEGVWFGSGAAQGVAVLFPGQGSQHLGMTRDLVCQFPEAFAALQAAEAAFPGLADRMYPRPAFKPDAKAAQEDSLKDTRAAQPALGASGLGAWRVLESFGLPAAAFGGHSYGELPALCAAGRIAEEDLFALSVLRGRLMGDGDGGRGGMLAVQVSADDARKLIAEEKLDLVLANINAPAQSVLSGRKDEVARAAKACEARSWRAVTLPVSAAFHSPLVAPAAEPFRKSLEKVRFKAGAPVYANKTAVPYPAAEKACRDLLAGQLASSVDFVGMVSAMYAAGARVFVECGAASRLSGLVSLILAGKDAAVLSVDSGGKRSGAADLARALAQLAALGQPVDLKKWEGGEEAVRGLAARKKAKLSVRLSGANHRSTKPQSKPIPSAPVSVPSASAPSSVLDALRLAQEQMAALQRLQEQTAALHQKFLEGQEAAFRSIQALSAQQSAFAAGGVALPALPAAVPMAPSNAGTRGSAPQPAAPPAAAQADVMPILLAVVSEKTGYPAEALNADMDLESDLGIDSIKRVEILSAIHEKLPGAPKVKPEHLGTLRTLKLIAGFLSKDVLPSTGPGAAMVPAPGPSLDVMPVLLAVVSEKTGYPAEALNADMDLESDLGIDSIKRVEILSAIQEKLPGAPKVKPEHLGTLRTLKLIAEFLSKDVLPSIGPGSGPSQDVMPILLAVVSEKTGYPAEALNADMDLESDLGIDSIKRVEILSAIQEKLPGAPKVKPEHLATLRTLKLISEFLSQGAPAAPAPASASAAAAPAIPSAPQALSRSALKAVPFEAGARKPVAVPAGAELWVTDDASGLSAAVVERLSARGFKARLVDLARPPLPPKALGGLVVLAPVRPLSPAGLWEPSSEAYLKSALSLAKTAAPALAAGPSFFVTVSRLDGAFGLAGSASESDPVFGGLAGLAKTAAREWATTSCRALDADPAWTDRAALSELIAAEALLQGPAELGLGAESRTALELREEPAPEGKPPFSEGDLVLVTGGARGVTAEAAAALAESCRPTLVLIGRSPAPVPEEPWLAGLKTEAEIQKTLLERAGRKASPKELGAECRRLLAAREIRSNLARLEALGAKVQYLQADARDGAALAQALRRLEAEHGPVRGLVHGAGVLADKLIADKAPEQWDAVIDTKLASLRQLLAAVSPAALKGIVLFSSTTARLGRTGQSDYAMANEALNKAAQLLSRRLPSCRVVSIGWGPWDGGMVNAGLKRLFESEGVGLVGPREGGRAMLAELSSAGPAEVVVLGVSGARGEGATPAGPLEPAFERTLSVEVAPFLESHVINGKAVLPFAVVAEWLAHAALHRNPGLRFHGLEGLRILKGVVLDGRSSSRLTAEAGKAAKQGGLFAVQAELRGGPERTLHAKATVLLAASLPAAPAAAPAPALGAYPRGVERAYSDILFHGPEMRPIRAVEGVSREGIAVESAAALAPSSWMRQPPRDQWLADPMALDAAFQAMILWSVETLGAPCLPSHAAAFRLFARFPEGGTRVVIRARSPREGQALADADFLDLKGGLVARLEGLECTVDRSLTDAFRRRSLETVSAGG